MRKIKLILIIIISLFAFNITYVNASTNAKTLAELRKELQALKDKKASNDYKKTRTKEEINNAHNDIKLSKEAIEKGREQIEEATKQISKLNDEIDESKDKMRVLLNAYQKSEGDNLYLEYLFESESYADFVYRYSIIKQLADYTEEQINIMSDKIEENEELKVELNKKEVELNNQIASLEKSIVSFLGYNRSILSSTSYGNLISDS